MARLEGVCRAIGGPTGPPSSQSANRRRPAFPLYYRKWSLYGLRMWCGTGHFRPFWHLQMRRPECVVWKINEVESAVSCGIPGYPIADKTGRWGYSYGRPHLNLIQCLRHNLCVYPFHQRAQRPWNNSRAVARQWQCVASATPYFHDIFVTCRAFQTVL